MGSEMCIRDRLAVERAEEADAGERAAAIAASAVMASDAEQGASALCFAAALAEAEAAYAEVALRLSAERARAETAGRRVDDTAVQESAQRALADERDEVLLRAARDVDVVAVERRVAEIRVSQVLLVRELTARGEARALVKAALVDGEGRAALRCAELVSSARELALGAMAEGVDRALVTRLAPGAGGRALVHGMIFDDTEHVLARTHEHASGMDASAGAGAGAASGVGSGVNSGVGSGADADADARGNKAFEVAEHATHQQLERAERELEHARRAASDAIVHADAAEASRAEAQADADATRALAHDLEGRLASAEALSLIHI